MKQSIDAEEAPNGGEKECSENEKPVIEAQQAISKVSKVIYDEKTGTVTLVVASKEEIAQANEELTMGREQSQGAENK
jgi:hypothetical protein